MAERKPIVLIAGSLRELPSGDTVVGASGGSGTVNPLGMFYKPDSKSCLFYKSGLNQVTFQAGAKIEIGGVIVTLSASTAIFPWVEPGNDYAVWMRCTNAEIKSYTVEASTSYTTPPGAGTWRMIGGFHFAPGSCALAQAGGDTTPQINEYSVWDLKFRPACGDPRGMTLVAGSFWADIYLLGVDHLTNGTSKYNVSIATSSAPPKIPTKFGGTGSNAYSTLNWWEANEVLQSWGKRSPTYDEFAALAYGTTEATSSGGSDVPTTGVSGTGATNAWNKFTSRWGVIQATGCMWIRGGEFGGGAASAAWTANTGGRGSTYQMENAVLLGGYWGYTTESGSRCSHWYLSPTTSNGSLGARGVCDHLCLDDFSGSIGSGGSSTPQVYVQPTAPTVPAGTPYIWVQTGLGADGTDHTIWIGDGL